MKIRPIIQDSLKTTHTSYDVDIELGQNITFICGESGIGKSAMYYFLQELAIENKKIRCLNHLDQNKNYKNTIKQSRGKLFVIDNADILLDTKMRQYIAMDTKNQYVIIGRNPEGLMLTKDEIYELCSQTTNGRTRFTIRNCF